MSGSSALKSDFSFSEIAPQARPSVGAEITKDIGNGGTLATLPLRAPSFDGYVYSATARKAARLNASSVSAAERQALSEERSALLDKLFAGTISQSEENRLEYVRWSLDRIEDALHGDALDELESAVVRYEQLQRDIARLARQLGVAAVK